MKFCIVMACCILATAACKSDKSDSSTTTNPPPAPAGSATTPPAADPHAGHQGSGSAAAPTGANGPDCASEFDHAKFADKHMACVECEKHRGHGAMEAECKNAIAKPWK